MVLGFRVQILSGRSYLTVPLSNHCALSVLTSCIDRPVRQTLHLFIDTGMEQKVWANTHTWDKHPHAALPVNEVRFLRGKCMGFTIPTVELDSIGGQLDRNTTLAGLWKFEILNLAVRAEHIHIQDWGFVDEGGKKETRKERDREREIQDVRVCFE